MNAELLNYLAELMPAAPVDCAGCTRQVSASKAIVKEGKFFHSAECAEIHLAPIVKPKAARSASSVAVMPNGAVWDV